MIAALAMLLGLVGFGAIAASNDRFQTIVVGKRLTKLGTRIATIGGYSCLGAMLAASITGYGVGTGLVVFVGLSTVVAGIVVSAVTYRRDYSNR